MRRLEWALRSPSLRCAFCISFRQARVRFNELHMPSGTVYGACASLRCWAPTGLHRRRVSVVPIHTKSDSSSTRPRPRSICAWLQRASIFYERFGVRRSVDPDGPQADWGRAFLCVSRGARRLSLQSAQLHHQSHSGAETAAGFDVDEFVVVFLLRVWGGALVADAGIASQPTCAKWQTALSDTCRYSAGNAG